MKLCIPTIAVISVLLAHSGFAAGSKRGDAGPPGGCWQWGMPCERADPIHPMPKWVIDMARLQYEQQREAFRRLSAEEQVEFAASSLIHNHPPRIQWTFELRAAHRDDLNRLLEGIVRREPSDRFAAALVLLVYVAYDKTWKPTEALLDALKWRIAKMKPGRGKTEGSVWLEKLLDELEQDRLVPAHP